jgi:Fic family protein
MAASSLPISSKSKTSKFSAMRAGFVDFGIADRPGDTIAMKPAKTKVTNTAKSLRRIRPQYTHAVRRMSRYIHQLPKWPHFQWDHEAVAGPLAEIRHRQGRLIGRMESLGFTLQREAELETLTLDVLKSSEIEGERLDAGQVRSSIARRLGIETAGTVAAERDVEGAVEMMLDATQNYAKPLSDARLYGWHAALLPTGRSGMRKIIVGAWRNDAGGPMQVVSGPVGKEKVRCEAPAAPLLDKEVSAFLSWANDTSDKTDLVLRAALAHLWFVTIHPFDDGNGRIARAIADWALARSENTRGS